MEIKNQTIQIFEEFLKAANLSKGQLIIVGCSTSEVLGDKIGTNSSLEVAKQIFEGISKVLNPKGIHFAVQCCEHLNRAIVVERSALTHNEELVNVIPQPKAGGSLATVAYNNFKTPVIVEELSADAGIDIGETLIGMHLKKVAVPVRLTIKKLGNANITCARTRPKFIGGERAIYDKNLL